MIVLGSLHNFPAAATKLKFCIFNGAVNNLHSEHRNDAFCTQMSKSFFPFVKYEKGCRVLKKEIEDMA